MPTRTSDSSRSKQMLFGYPDRVIPTSIDIVGEVFPVIVCGFDNCAGILSESYYYLKLRNFAVSM